MENLIDYNTWSPNHQGASINPSYQRWVFVWIQKKASRYARYEEEAKAYEKNIDQRNKGWLVVCKLNEIGYR